MKRSNKRGSYGFCRKPRGRTELQKKDDLALSSFEGFLQDLCFDTMFIFQYPRLKHEVHPILAFYLNHKQFVTATKNIRRNNMHKYTRSILGNPSQEGKKTQPILCYILQ
jgi:hypothetical protein